MFNKFYIDNAKGRICKLKEDMPENVPFNEAYVEYAIPMNDVDDLVIALKANGNIKPEVQQGQSCTNPGPSSIFNSSQMQDIMNTQAKMLDRQLSIIETMLAK